MVRRWRIFASYISASRVQHISDPHSEFTLNLFGCCIWGMMQMRVYHVPISDTQELRQRLVQTWAEFQLSVYGGDAIDQWRKRLEA